MSGKRCVVSVIAGAVCVAVALALSLSCNTEPPSSTIDTAQIVGVKIYGHDGDLQTLFDRWQVLGVNTVFVGEELARREDFRFQAERTGTDLFLIFPVFLAIDEVIDDPSLYAVTADGSKAVDDWVEFACPSREDFRAQRIEEAVALVREVRPAALSLDFIRYFVFWEMVGPDQDPRSLPDSCFCPRCLSRFTDEMGRAIPPGDPTESAGWIYEHALDDWVEFKRQTIIGMVEEIIAAVREVQPEIAVNLHAVPWRETDFDRAVVRIAGQDHSVLGGMVNYLSPMCYSFMQYQPPEWIASVVQDLDRQSACPVLPSIQVGTAYREGKEFGVAEFESALRAALEPPSAGVVFWSWDAIAAEPEKEAAIARVLAE